MSDNIRPNEQRRNKAILCGLPCFYPLMNERGEDAIGRLKKRYYGGCKNAAEMHEESGSAGRVRIVFGRN